MIATLRARTLGGALCLLLPWTQGCGGSTGDPLGRGRGTGNGGSGEMGAGGRAHAGDGGEAGAESGGAGTGATPSTAAGGAVGNGGRVGSGGSIGSGGEATGGRDPGTGGRNVGTGGTGGVPSWSCRTPYKAPVVGPRKDGPANPGMSCDTLPDELVLERYADESAKVPKGFYYEEPGEIVSWDLDAGCSASLDATAAAGGAQVGGMLDGTYAAPYFFEAAFCNGDARTRYRRLRCDYYDGMRLKRGPTGGVDDLLFWSGLMWFAPNHDSGGSTLISGGMTIGDATDFAEICTARVTFGDFGLCDTITLTSTRVSGTVDGNVAVVSTVDGRTIKGKCH